MLQYIVLSTAWNILGGYTGYTNFGTGAFFALGAYSSAVLHKLPALSWRVRDRPAIPLPVMILVGGIVSGIVGLGTGYLTLRLRGVFFAIATLAMTIVVQTLIVNWDYVGGSRGIYIIRPADAPLGGGYIQYLYTLMIAAGGDLGRHRPHDRALAARASALPRSATTSWRPRRAACRPCGSS